MSISRLKTGAALHALRLRSDLTQTQLAARLQLQQSTISRVEAGELNVSFEDMQRWVAVFDITFADFIDYLANIDFVAKATVTRTNVVLRRPALPDPRIWWDMSHDRLMALIRYAALAALP